LSISGWVFPSAIVALLPKCPVCLAANLAVLTGLGLSITTVTYLRWALLILCVASLLYVFVNLMGRFRPVASHFKYERAQCNTKIVSREEWIQTRTALLAKEKELTHLRDELSRQRLKLPWVKVEKEYVFDAPNGKVTLSDLFDGRSQLFIKHFMLGPGQAEQCVGCSFEVDHIEGVLIHLQNHDVTYAVVARAPIEEIETMRQRMGWRFRWVSSYHSDFNYDFNVSFTPEQIAEGRAFYNYRYENPGLEDRSGDSVFFKDESGQIFHTYSTFGRGGEEFLGAYRILDVLPKGRNENGPYHTLADWVRPKNAYGENGIVEANGRYHVHGCGCAVHK
jgi:predicted dithiol-disulfide oxidoreductase (DUF899 family)